MECNDILRKYLRYLMVLFNFLFALTGILILSVGASIKGYYNEYGNLLNNQYFYASDFLIAVGVIIFCISFFGCCGALTDNACMTRTFSALLIIIFILELLVGIGGIFLKHKTEDVVKAAMTRTMAEYDQANATEVTDVWDLVQNRFNCCGVEQPMDWINATNSTHGQLPVSCCQIPAGTVNTFSCSINSTTLHKEGCLTEFGDYIRGHTAWMEGVGIGLAIIQLMGIVFSCYLAKQINSDYQTV